MIYFVPIFTLCHLSKGYKILVHVERTQIKKVLHSGMLTILFIRVRTQMNTATHFLYDSINHSLDISVDTSLDSSFRLIELRNAGDVQSFFPVDFLRLPEIITYQHFSKINRANTDSYTIMRYQLTTRSVTSNIWWVSNRVKQREPLVCSLCILFMLLLFL